MWSTFRLYLNRLTVGVTSPNLKGRLLRFNGNSFGVISTIIRVVSLTTPLRLTRGPVAGHNLILFRCVNLG